METNDCIKDGTTSLADFAIFANHWLRTNYGNDNDRCGGADFDKDGKVDQADLAVLVKK